MIFNLNKIFVLIAISIMNFSANAFAQWHEINSGVAEDLVDGCFVNDSVGYIISNNGKVLKTLDGGNSWIESANFNGTFSSIAHIGVDTIYIGGDYFYMSINGGNSWNLVSNPNFFILDLVFFKTNIGFALTPNYDVCYYTNGPNYQADYKVYKTTDHGLTWEEEFDSIESQSRFETLNDSVSFIAGGFNSTDIHCAGPWYNTSKKTINGGMQWIGMVQPYYGHSLISFVNDTLGYYLQSIGTLYKTIDGGMTYSPYATNTNAPIISHMKFVDADGGYFIAQNKIFKTSADSAIWDLDYYSFDTLSYLFKSNNQNLLCIGKKGTILKKNITPNLPTDTVLSLVYNPEMLEFGFVEVDSSKVKPIFFINNGTVPLSFNISSPANFKIGITSTNLQTSLSLNLNVNEDTIVYVEFIPQTDNYYTSSLLLEIANVNTENIPLLGKGYYGFRGNVEHDTTLCSDTLNIVGDIFVNSNAKLTICAGTFVRFLKNSKILVEGQLEAIADSLHPIEFWALNKNEINCLGIIVNNTTPNQTAVTLDFCKFQTEFWNDQITLSNGNASIKNSVFCNNTDGSAILIGDQSPFSAIYALVENCEIYNEGISAIKCINSDSVNIINCNIFNNHEAISNESSTAKLSIVNCNIHDNQGPGISGLGTFIIEKNNIYNNLGGISLENSSFKITGNTIYNNKSSTIGGISSKYISKDSYIIQNLIYNNENTQYKNTAYTYIASNGGGLCLSNSNNLNSVFIINNTICNNKTLGKGNNLFISDVKNVIKNNILFESNKSYNSVECLFGESFTEFENNCTNSPISGIIGKSNVIIDPSFIKTTDSLGKMTNLGNTDFSLMEQSGCINNGSDVRSLFPDGKDFIGNSRVFDRKIDIGAYEFQGYYKPATDLDFLVYPNPCEDFIYFWVNSASPCVLILYDITSHLLMRVEFINITSLDLYQLSKGIFLYQCKFSDGSVKNGKIFKN